MVWKSLFWNMFLKRSSTLTFVFLFEARLRREQNENDRGHSEKGSKGHLKRGSFAALANRESILKDVHSGAWRPE